MGNEDFLFSGRISRDFSSLKTFNAHMKKTLLLLVLLALLAPVSMAMAQNRDPLLLAQIRSAGKERVGVAPRYLSKQAPSGQPVQQVEIETQGDVTSFRVGERKIFLDWTSAAVTSQE